MGKPYAKEIDALPRTYSWARYAVIDAFAEALAWSTARPLVAVGSGGSCSVAQLAATLHGHFSPSLAKAVTPLEACGSHRKSSDVVYLLVTAGGRNSDILDALRHLARREPDRILVLVAREHSPIARLARDYRFVDCYEFDVPTGKDGFLATNSLLALSVILARGYTMALARLCPLPAQLTELVSQDRTFSSFLAGLRSRTSTLWQKDSLTVLYSPSVRAAADDLESKFTEAALGTVQLADFREFAHGRHNWIAQRLSSSAVLALATETDRHLAQRTLALLPDSVPSLHLEVPGDFLCSAVAAMAFVLCIALVSGEARGIDPGKPQIPQFGRKLYHLRGVLSNGTLDHQSLPNSAAAAIGRKARTPIDAMDDAEVAFWHDAWKKFRQRLSRVTYRAIVLDYDGTICDRSTRLTSPSHAITSRLLHLLDADVVVGVATGRGKSVRDALRAALPASHWAKVYVGYYNCACTGLLCDDDVPARGPLANSLRAIADALATHPLLQSEEAYSMRRHQLTLFTRPQAPMSQLFQVANELVAVHGEPGTRVVTSDHSVDILAPGVSKLTLLDVLRATYAWTASVGILCVGDRGRWPGNDVELLAHPHGLSVKDVSQDPHSCWNLAPAGRVGPDALLDYLSALSPSSGRFRFSPSKIRRSPRS